MGAFTSPIVARTGATHPEGITTIVSVHCVPGSISEQKRKHQVMDVEEAEDVPWLFDALIFALQAQAAMALCSTPS